VAYTRAIYFMKEKEVFDVRKINFEALASSYGLAVTPRIRFLKDKTQIKENDASQLLSGAREKNSAEALSKSSEDEKEDEEQLSSQSNLGKDEEEDNEGSGGTDEYDDELLTVTRRDVFNTIQSATPTEDALARIPSNKVSRTKDVAKKILKRGIKVNSKIRFHDDESS